MRHGRRGWVIALLLGAVFAVLSNPASAEDKFSAGEMAQSCEPVLAASKAAKNPDELELDNTFESGTCWGAFLGIQQFIVMKVEAENRLLNICAPSDLTLLQIVKIFDLFVRSNPTRQDEPFAKVAIAALRSAFPCK